MGAIWDRKSYFFCSLGAHNGCISKPGTVAFLFMDCIYYLEKCNLSRDLALNVTSSGNCSTMISEYHFKLESQTKFMSCIQSHHELWNWVNMSWTILILQTKLKKFVVPWKIQVRKWYCISSMHVASFYLTFLWHY